MIISKELFIKTEEILLAFFSVPGTTDYVIFLLVLCQQMGPIPYKKNLYQ